MSTPPPQQPPPPPAATTTAPMDASAAIADAKVPPGEDYEEIREQVCCKYLMISIILKGMYLK